MSRLNYLVRDPISFVGFPWRTTATLVRGRVFTMLYRLYHKAKMRRLQNDVCCFVSLNRYWGIVMYGPRASSWASQGRRTHDPRSPTSQPYPVPPQITWGVRIRTLHLNYVAGYTGPLLFLIERTQQLLRWQPGACALAAPSSGQVQSSFGLIGEGHERW